ncbi:hypothetical protein FRC07_008156 [Ceratobasidium sp. 392]|nr:hypothetical protein FRC07_008156 [Ceratobasidium sp. 392]
MSGSPSAVAITKAEGAQLKIAETYLVMLKKTGDLTGHLGRMREQAHKYSNTLSKCEVVQEHETIKGYTAILSGSALEDLTKRNDVESIIEERLAQLDSLNDDKASA